MDPSGVGHPHVEAHYLRVPVHPVHWDVLRARVPGVSGTLPGGMDVGFPTFDLMPTPSELPDLFGRATLVLGGHEGLHGTVEGLRITCIAVRSGDAAAAEDLVERADAFCRRVLVHFAAEEGADYFGTLSAESTPLAEGIARLKAEHAELTRCIAAIGKLAGAGRPAGAFVDELEKFLDGLIAHERHETSLLYGYLRPDD